MKVVICKKTDTTILWDTKGLHVKSKRRKVKVLYKTSVTGPHSTNKPGPQTALILHPSSPPGALFYGYLKLFRMVRSRRKDFRLCLNEFISKPHLKNAAH